MDACCQGDSAALPDQHLVQSQIRSNQVDCLFVSLQCTSLRLCSTKASAPFHPSLVHRIRLKSELMFIVEISTVGAVIFVLLCSFTVRFTFTFIVDQLMLQMYLFIFCLCDLNKKS